MAQENADPRREKRVDRRADRYRDTGPETAGRDGGERTKRVLKEADDLIEEVDEILYGEIKDAKKKEEIAARQVDEFQQKGGQ